MSELNATVKRVTDRITERSRQAREAYLQLMHATRRDHPPRKQLSCGNLAHAFAACNTQDKSLIAADSAPNLGIITAYNDMLSAHQPYKDYPDQIKTVAHSLGATAQVAGGVPAMCDGVTQGQPGMELSLFSRDVVAMATAVGLSHNMFDGNLFLGVCDKIVPGLLIGALSFGHLPGMFIPAGPMPSGISNKEKAAQRQKYAAGEINDAQLLAVESASYHSPGTCTFYGTANTNQLMMEFLGLHLPGASFVNPDDPLRPRLTEMAVKQLISNIQSASGPVPLCETVTEKSLVNAVVGLLATGGSTNHTLHLVAIAEAAGIQLTWQDMDELSSVVPLLARIYPNGQADINHFHHAGGMAYLFGQLRSAGLLHEDVRNIVGAGLDAYEREPEISNSGEMAWSQPVRESRDHSVLAPITQPFSANGGLRLLTGNLGQAVIKISAVAREHWQLEAPCIVFESQEELKEAFNRGELEQDFVAVVRFQGPAANGMPELHKMTPLLGVLQDKGFKVALVTDGRMSGASGKVPAAIHLSPEASYGGPISRLQTGDIITLDAGAGLLQVQLSEEALGARDSAVAPTESLSLGRKLFGNLRRSVSTADLGGSTFLFDK
ncbi:phosphogluconate dehydratase [Halioxenophilus sp. WMMB6]|uniref:phosphogluconate dehydratase n=1 Tax=Halioxenophilus sp. WMMB6 TaxID=3073815 RepID=UPI00295EABA3|nr:phosphogluconate dehydratase [Halioxenophilus sp. WMMB6]